MKICRWLLPMPVRKVQAIRQNCWLRLCQADRGNIRHLEAAQKCTSCQQQLEALPLNQPPHACAAPVSVTYCVCSCCQVSGLQQAWCGTLPRKCQR